MKSLVLLVALVQALTCSAAPLFPSDIEGMASRGLKAALAQVNSVYASTTLYRVTHGTVKRAIPLGQNTYDLMLKFTARKTECSKTSGMDPQTCALSPGFFVPTYCQARVRTTPTATQVMYARCGHDSSSESSEEYMGRHFNIPLNLAPAAPAPPAQTGHALHTPYVEISPNRLE